MTLAACLLCWATTARAISASGAGAEGATGYADAGTLGTGWMVSGGYFFKDTMFYSKGRGGAVVSAGRAFRMARWLAIWAGGGVFQAGGTIDGTAGGSDFRMGFDETVAYGDLGIVTPWLPFPVALSLYWHSTDLKDAGTAGPLAGSSFSGGERGAGLGVDVRVFFEFFLLKRRGLHRGLGVIVGYTGFMDLTPWTVTTRSGSGGEMVHRKWKPFSGESLQLGLEYEL